jgi:hypothetical protein
MPFTIDLLSIVGEVEILQHAGDTKKYIYKRKKSNIYLDFYWQIVRW